MEQQTDIEILQAYAKSKHREIHITETPYPRTGIRTTQKYRRTVFMPNNPQKTSFFVWFNDPYTKTIGQTVIFSGAFIPLSSRVKSKLDIRNSYVLDKLSPFSKARRNKIGNGHFDSKVTISGEIDTAAERLLSRADMQKQILQALKIQSYYHVSINQFNIDFVPELEGKPTLSIIEPHGWEMKRENIESMFNHIEKIRDILI